MNSVGLEEPDVKTIPVAGGGGGLGKRAEQSPQSVAPRNSSGKSFALKCSCTYLKQKKEISESGVHEKPCRK